MFRHATISPSKSAVDTCAGDLDLGLIIFCSPYDGGVIKDDLSKDTAVMPQVGLSFRDGAA